MTLANAKFAHGLIFGVAFILAGSTAQAGHYGDIDDHSRDIERDAERAEAIVKYNFRHAPCSITGTLKDALCSVAETAHSLHECSCRKNNIHNVEAKANLLTSQFLRAQAAFEDLSRWVNGPSCGYTRFGSFSCNSRPSRTDQLQLRSLCKRMDDIAEELTCMNSELRRELARHNRAVHGIGQSLHSHSHHGDRDHRHSSRVVPQIQPLGSIGRPGHDFSRGRQSYDRDPFGSRFMSRNFGHSRLNDSSYFSTRIGGFGLSFRLK